MFNRFVLVFLATALAMVVLFLTMLYDRSESTRADRSDVEVDQGGDWPDLDKGHTQGAGRMDFGKGGMLRPYHVQENEKGQLFEIAGEELNPLPDGVLQITKPLTRIHLKPYQRVVQIRADEGTFVAPDNNLRSGNFHGNVILTLLECAPGEKLNYDRRSPHRKLRLFLTEAQFDLELGQIYSRGPVNLTMGRNQFLGRGMTVDYDEATRLVTRFEITRGEKLILAGGGEAKPLQQKPKDVPDKPEPTKPVEKDEQYYRASFHDNVHVATAGLDIADCTQMDVFFPVDRELDQDEFLNELSDPDEQDDNSSAAPVPADGAIDTGNDRDITVLWNGRLVIVPVDALPDDMAEIASPGDRALTMLGPPLRITADRQGATSDKQEARISVPRLDYAMDTGRLRLLGNKSHRLIVNTSDAELITGRMLLDAATSQALFPGGVLRAHGEKTVVDELEPDLRPAADFDRLAPGTQLDWSEQLIVSLYLKPGGSGRGLDDITAIREAVFAGNVNVSHPRFDMHSDKLTVELEEPTESTETQDEQRQRISSMTASGDVLILSHAKSDASQFSLQSNELIIGFEHDQAGTVPTVLANGEVEARQGGVTLRASSLLTELTRPGEQPLLIGRRLDEETPGADPKDAEHRLELKRVTADDNVSVELTNPDQDEQSPVTIFGDHLVAEGDTVNLIGTDDTPARIENDDGMIVSHHFEMDQASQTLRTDDPGKLYAFQFDADDDPNKDNPKQPKTPTTEWTRSMSYDHVNHLLQFLGDVRTNVTKGNRTSKLSAESLVVELVDVSQGTELDEALDDGSGSLSDAERAQLTALPRTGGNLALWMITATGPDNEDVHFEAATWGHPDDEQTPLTRITIKGPRMVFDRMLEDVQVMDSGVMLLEDYRPEKTDDDSEQTDPLVSVSGRGATLFNWTGRLVLDATYNDMLIEENVRMYHQPVNDDSEGVQLDCQRFLADFEQTGGLEKMMGPDAPRPDLRAINASGDLRVIGRNREVYADRLDYTHSDQIAELKVNQGKRVQMIDTVSGGSTYADLIRWDLMKDRVEIERPTGSAPVPERGR